MGKVLNNRGTAFLIEMYLSRMFYLCFSQYTELWAVSINLRTSDPEMRD